MIRLSPATINVATAWLLLGTAHCAARLLAAVSLERAAAGLRPLDDAVVDDATWFDDAQPIIRIVSPAAGCVLELDTYTGTLTEV